MIESLVAQIEARHAEVQAQMSDPEVISDRQRYADAGRLYNQLDPAAKLAEEWRRAVDDAEGAQELLSRGDRLVVGAAEDREDRVAEEDQLAARAQARASKDWAASDAIRDTLAAAGVVVEDGPDGANWSLKRG